MPRPNRICEILADRSSKLTSQTASLDVLGNMSGHYASRLARGWTNKSDLLESGVPQASTLNFASNLSLPGALKKFTFVSPKHRLA